MNKVDIFVSVVAVLRSYARFLPAFVDDVHRILNNHYSNYELVLVDNGSRDETPKLVRGMLQSRKCTRYLRLSRRMSAEMATMAGLDAAIGDYVVTLHPEFDPPSEIPAMVDECRSGTDVVFGSAPFPRPPGLLYRSLRWGFYRFSRLAFGIEPVRGNSVYRCMSRAAVNALTRVRRRKRFFGQLASEIGLSVATHEYEFISRSGKQPRLNLRRAARTATSMAMNHSSAPMRLVSLLGLAGSFISLVYSLYVVGIYFSKDDVMPGWTTLSLQMSGLFFLAFVMLTLIGEHLGRLIDESVDRPLYHVREEQSSSVMLSDLTRRNVMDRSE
jgi:glycosyltransferase involved in cell wall biosynthesis